MNRSFFVLILATLIFIQSAPGMALSDYQRGILDGLSRGWSMAQKYDQAVSGDPSAYNQAYNDYNAWIESLFGMNESLMLKPFPASRNEDPYTISRTFSPVHSIDSSWNQSRSLLTDPDDSGMVAGYPAETYYSIGPALANF